jgi:hypothetical protein
MPTFPLQHRHAELDANLTRQEAKIRQETSPLVHTPTPGATAPGDTRKLRGIPAIARGVAGHIPGTNPTDVR